VFLDLGGYPVILVDTAGIRESSDPIEQEGVARARRRAESADLTLWLNDGGDSEAPSAGSPSLSVRTKIDLSDPSPPPPLRGRAPAELAISAKTGAGIDRLLDVIAELAEERMSSREPAVLTLERHKHGFEEARQALVSTLKPEAAEPELIAEDLRRAASAMDRIVGRIGVEDVLGEIFARLCVGK
jgi:tRNA modification GTPase